MRIPSVIVSLPFKHRSLLFLCLFLCSIGFYPLSGMADRVTQRFGDCATCTKKGVHIDTTVSEQYGDGNTPGNGYTSTPGTAEFLSFRPMWGTDHVLMRFDLSSIPSGTKVYSATLRFFVSSDSPSGSSGVTINIFPIKDPAGTGMWSESEACFKQKRRGIPWTPSGDIRGALDPSPIASIYFKQWQSITISLQDYYDADITNAVQGWVNTPSTNMGFAFQDT
ncbi:MAG: DNRLRE domain-containing protein, partial [SAR324 cluster bacterium]|nr:DNRLRE domain-containing protein [SAR324 cluster bacterium]